MFSEYFKYQAENQAVYVDVAFDGTAVSATTPTGGAVKNANYQIFVQRITLTYATHAAGKVFTIQDSNSSAKIIASRADLAAAAGVPDVVVWDFGPKGIPLTLGKDLQYTANTGNSGWTGSVHIEGYQKLAATVAMASTN